MTEVSDEVVRLVTSEPLMAHLATCADGRPHVAPVWYDYDEDGDIVEVLTRGRKLANLEANPRVALSIQKDVDGEAQWRVTMLGTATIVEDDEAREAAIRRINEKYTDSEEAWPEAELVRISTGTATSKTY